MAEMAEWAEWAPVWQTPEGGACLLHFVPYVDCQVPKAKESEGLACEGLEGDMKDAAISEMFATPFLSLAGFRVCLRPCPAPA